jgi:hypothetical protein
MSLIGYRALRPAAQKQTVDAAPSCTACDRASTPAAPTAKPRPTYLPGAVGSSPSPKPKRVHLSTAYEPYVDMQYTPTFDLAGSVRTAGVHQYILGFVTSQDGCTPAWGGSTPIDDAAMVSRVKAFRAAGGSPRISFGGATGSELGSVCTSASDLAAAYQQVIDVYSLTKIDFDIEGDELGDSAADTRRAEAIAILEKNASAAGRSLNVSLTLPVNPSGFTATPIAMLTAAANAGASIDAVNVMAMDYGNWAAPDPAGRMGTYAINAVTAAQAKVKSIFGLSSAEAWSRMAVTPLIGVGSPSAEVFTVSDAAKVSAFASSKGLAFVSMWAITRDRPCPSGTVATADSDACAGNASSKYAFSRAFLG